MSDRRGYFVAQVPRLLNASSLRVRFGTVEALTDLSIGVDAGEIVGVVGHPGSGKSTLLRVLGGHLRPMAGRITFDHHPIDGDDPSANVRRGLSACLRPIPVVGGESVLTNLRIGFEQTRRRGGLSSLFQLPGYRREEIGLGLAAANLLELVGLTDFADVPCREMSPGQQVRIALARALAMRPRVLLMDDPLAGLDHDEISHMLALFAQVNQQFGVSMLITARTLQPITRLCTRVAVLHLGRKRCEGPPADVEEDANYHEVFPG